RALLQALEQSTVVLVRSTRAQLIEAVRNATLEIGNDSSQMMRNDLELRITIHYSGKNEPGKSDAGLVRPAEHAADFVFRVGLGRVVRHLPGTCRMEQDRLTGS